MRNFEPTAEQFFQLNYLNNFLIQKQNEIAEKRNFYLEIIAKAATKKAFTTDFEIDLKVKYYVDEALANEEEGRIWTYLHCSLQHDLDLWFDADNREGDDLKLDKRCCYLLHNLLYHSRLDLEIVLQIKMVWIDIILTDQNILDINLNTGETKPTPNIE